jgi:hypothetical protein
MPHAVPTVPFWHLPVESQQPVGHDVPSHWHAPWKQRWPAWHCGAPLHSQSPAVPHESARVGSHVWQTPPGVPHAAADAGHAHWPASGVQQPPVQTSGWHTQTRFSQSVPLGQGPPVSPHVQVPDAQ